MGAQRAELSFEVSPDSELASSPAVEKLRSYLTSLLSEGFPPSVSLAVVERGGTVLQAFGGYACVTGEPVPTTLETCYDLASLTKVVCTVTLALLAGRARVPRPRRPGDQVAPSVPARKHHFAAPFHPHSRPGRPPALLREPARQRPDRGGHLRGGQRSAAGG